MCFILESFTSLGGLVKAIDQEKGTKTRERTLLRSHQRLGAREGKIVCNVERDWRQSQDLTGLREKRVKQHQGPSHMCMWRADI